MNQNDKRNDQNNKGGKNLQGVLRLVAWALLLTLVLRYAGLYINSRTGTAASAEIPYSTFLDLIEEGKAEAVRFDSESQLLRLTTKEDYTYTKEDGTDFTGKEFYTVPVNNDALIPLLDEKGVKFTAGPYKPPMSTGMALLISYVLPFLLIMLMFSLFWRWMSKKGGMGGIGGIGGVGKANAKVYMEKQTGVTFRDVAGQDEAKESLTEIIDFLHNPQKYTEIGAKLPKGALLVGPPGTGKTLLAKAVAGEANVPFFSISGSDFVEMFVGVGASRVRDLFKEAAKVAPCIVFIDEIDTIGKTRDSGRFGGNDEREQTLNQLLAEMDGFDPTKGVILLAATNRPEVLDQALLRPGRFDRRVIVDKPDLEGRIQILKVHAKNVKMDETVDFREVALATSGAVGADLANMINEAAILAVRNHRQAVSQKDLLDSVEVVLVGKEKKSRVLSKEERKIVSYHEVGHALVSAIQKHSEPVQKITIVPRTMGALGYVMNVPEEEKYLNSEEEIRAMLVEFTAGRVAEELVFGSITTGASNDIEKATRIARAMVTQYGMSKRFGFVQLESQTSQYLDDGRRVMNCSEQTAAEVDEEVMIIMKQSYEQARKILTEHRKALDQIAAFLIEKETITGKEFMDILAKVEQPDNTAGSESTEKTEA